MSLRAMPPWLYRGGQDDYQFNDLVKPEDLQKLPPLDDDEVRDSSYLVYVATLSYFLLLSAYLVAKLTLLALPVKALCAKHSSCKLVDSGCPIQRRKTLPWYKVPSMNQSF